MSEGKKEAVQRILKKVKRLNYWSLFDGGNNIDRDKVIRIIEKELPEEKK